MNFLEHNLMKTKTYDDPVVAEVRKVKDFLSAKFGYDVAAILSDVRKREKTSGHKLVSFAHPKTKVIR